MTLSKLGVKVFSIFVLLASFATASEARKIHMAVATFSQSVLPMVVAQEKGYFRGEDLEVELILMTASVANMALLGGNVDFISSGPSVVGAIALAKGFKVQRSMFKVREQNRPSPMISSMCASFNNSAAIRRKPPVREFKVQEFKVNRRGIRHE
jgi:ABC-type nitrate/sulfonate/bicarbonate transport system substrate-binding protein